MNAFIAFDTSPVGSPKMFMDWLVQFAAPCAIDGRTMTVEEEFAFVDYEIPEAMRRNM